MKKCQACINREAGILAAHESTVKDAERVYKKHGGKYPAFKYNKHRCSI